MNFEQLYSQLQNRPKSGAGLPALTRLLERLGNPQEHYKIIHVAGTNGKGTVCTLLAHTLACAGYQTGLFVSPHLISPTERIRFNGKPISQDDFCKAVQTVLACEEELLNFFEILTVAALVYFAVQEAQYVMLETGLGGRKDPTNICKPVLSVITSIGLDHTALLGSTLAEIAAEKAGIIKPGVGVLCGECAPEAACVLEQMAITQQAPLIWVEEGCPFYEYAHDFVNGCSALHTADRQEWNLHLLGEKQTLNACLVYQAAQQLGIAEEKIKTAFETVRLPGRFEQIKKGDTTFILDGAHNPQAISALMNFWQKTPYAVQPATLLCGFMKDKDFKTMLGILCPQFERVIVTVPPSARAAQQADYGNLLNNPHCTFEPDYQKAFSLAQQVPVVLCTGSFYLVGAVRQAISA